MTSTDTSSSDRSAAVEPLFLTPEQTRESFPAVMSFLTSYFPCQALYTVVRLKVPDAIGSGCFTVDDIVRRLDASAANGTGSIRTEGLYRCLRLLAACGFFEESANPEDGSAMYRLTPLGALLQTNVRVGGGDGDGDGGAATLQPSLACGVHHTMEAPMWEAWLKLDDYVMGTTNDVTPWEAAHGMNIFDYYGQHEESSRPFNEFMSVVSGTKNAGVLLTLVPWEEYSGKRVVDVGGGFGTIARAIKASFPGIDMVSLDLPDVVEQARATGEAPPEDEVQLVAGDMFDAATYPENASAVLLKNILHDWDDDSCRKILLACHKALPEDGKVLVGDTILPNPGESKNDDGVASLYRLDMLMMLIAGKERTKRQWTELAASAGFKVESFNTDSPRPNDMMTTLVKAMQ